MKRYIKYITLLFAAASLSGCLRDRYEDVPVTRAGDYVEVELSVEVEDNGEVLTRAFTPTQENYVDNIDVLVFEYTGVDADGRGNFLYSTHGVDIRPSGTNGSEKKFKALLATKVNNGGTEVSLIGKEVFLLVLANSRDIWDEAKATTSYYDSYRDVVDKLIYHSNSNWDVSTSSTQYFPMSSPSTNMKAVLTESVKGSFFGTIKLVRAVTAMDVGFNYGSGKIAQGFDKFELEKVVLCRFPDRGYVSGTYGFHWTYSSREPSNKVLIDRTYTLDAPSKYGIFNEIYVPLVSYSAIHLKRYPYLLIAGYYDGGGLSWYRMEMPTELRTPTGGADPYYATIATERNNRYIFKVEEVQGPGYATKQEAIDGGPNLWANLSVVPWSETQVDQDIDGIYNLDLSAVEMSLNPMGVTAVSDDNNRVSVATDYSGGWKVESVTYDAGIDPWLEARTDVALDKICLGAAKNETGADRYAYVHVSAGRWKQTITVTQECPKIEISSSSIIIPFVPNYYFGSRNRLQVETNVSSQWVASAHNGSDVPIDWLFGNVIIQGTPGAYSKSGSGDDYLYVRSLANTAKATRTGYITVSIVGTNVSQTIEVKQEGNTTGCGIGGVAVNKQLTPGGKTYGTHLYGDNMVQRSLTVVNLGMLGMFDAVDQQEMLDWIESGRDEWDLKCFMTENSVEGTAEYTSYDFSSGSYEPRGNYYTYEQAAMPGNACPTGWHLPDNEKDEPVSIVYSAGLEEFGYLMPEFFAAPNQFGQKWWYGADRQSAGYYDNGRWWGWDADEIWWMKNGSDSRWWFFFNDGDYICHLSGTSDANATTTVRCVEGAVEGLNVSPSLIELTAAENRDGQTEENTVHVAAGTSWSLEPVKYVTRGPWNLEVHKTADGRGFYVQSGANTTKEDRTAEITVVSGKLKSTVTVTQKANNSGGGTPPTDGPDGSLYVLSVDDKGQLNLDGEGVVVLFKWGSTIALASPVSVVADPFDVTDIAWVPPGFDYEELVRNVNAATGTKTVASGTYNAKWWAIPCVRSANDEAGGSNVFPENTPENLAKGYGDPCRFAKKKGDPREYRMPDMVYNPDYNPTGGWLWFEDIGPDEQNPDGRHNVANTIFYPACQGRNQHTGAVNTYIRYGPYWAKGGPAGGPHMRFDKSSVVPYATGGRDSAMGIRCIPVE